MGRRAATTPTDFELLLDRFANADDALAARALSRAWERGRDQALQALSATEIRARRDDGGRW